MSPYLDVKAGGVLEKSKFQKARAPRVLVDQKAVLVTSDGTELDVVVTNLSAQGFRMKAEETLYEGESILIGEAVIVRVQRQSDLRAKIVWTSGCDLGGVFLDPPSLLGGLTGLLPCADRFRI